VDGKPKFDNLRLKWWHKKMYELTELQKQGKFKAKRNKDVLTIAIGSKEHGGPTRGVSSKLTIRDGFPKDRASYRRHDATRKK
jgi:hypothetical protein